MRTGVMICGHGSRDPEALAECERLAAGLKARLPAMDIESGYLEFARPTIGEGFEKLAARGAQRILALPAMLSAASHVKNDLPSAVNSFAVAHPDVEMHLGRVFSIEPKLVRATSERIEEAERRGTCGAPRSQILLLVVGRGTNDPDANSTIGTLARMVGEGLGFGRVEVAYSGTASPPVEPALRRAVALGFRRIVVFPYFLFTGVLVKRVYAVCEMVAADHPEIEIVKAPYLRDHPLVLDSFVERVAEIDARGHAQPARGDLAGRFPG